MGPKKEIKKEVVEEPPKPVEPEIPPHQLQGYGRFSYANGAQYEGEWRLIKGIKSKHGKGTLIVAQNSSQSLIGKQLYEGQWFEDKMHGFGTYFFPDGAVYKGNWKANEFSGHGLYEFPNGTIYEGEFQNNQMHGTGFYIDPNGRKWGGQFRKGKYQSKHQAQLVKQKARTLKKIEVKKEVEATLQNILDAIAKSDKKTLKDNLSPFFAAADNVKEYVKDPYSKFDQRPPEKWTDILTIAKTGAFKVLQNQSEATLISSDRILGKQLEGMGQFVEIVGTKQQKIIKIGLVGLQNKRWIVIVANEQQKKK